MRKHKNHIFKEYQDLHNCEHEGVVKQSLPSMHSPTGNIV